MINLGERVKAVREGRGLNQKELAKLAAMSPSQLCLIEKGRVSPTICMVDRLAAALDMGLAEFLSEDGVKARRRPSADAVADDDQEEDGGYLPIRVVEPDAARALKALKAGVAEAEVTAAECTLAFNRAHLRYQGAGAALAEELRGDLGMGTAPVGDLVSALRYRGVTVVEAKMDKRSGSVVFWNKVRKAPAVVLNAAMTPERRTYRLVYELGSAALYASLGVRLDESLEQHRFLTDFTAAFLMPGSSVRTCVAAAAVVPADWTLTKVLPLKAYFGVSAEAFVLRLEELGLIVPKLRLNLREKLHAYYKKHPKAMEPQVGCGIG